MVQKAVKFHLMFGNSKILNKNSLIEKITREITRQEGYL